MSLKWALAPSERLFFVHSPAGAQAQPPREEQVLAGRCRQKRAISGRCTNLQLPWLGQGFSVSHSSPFIDIGASQQLGSAEFDSRGSCSGVVPTRQHPSDLRSFRRHWSSYRTHQEDRCAVGLLSPTKGNVWGCRSCLQTKRTKLCHLPWLLSGSSCVSRLTIQHFFKG